MANDGELKKIHDPAIILELLSSAKESGAEVFVWRFVGGAKHVSEARIEAIRRARNDFSLVPADGQDRVLQELVGTLHQIDLYIPSAALLLRCNLKSADGSQRYYLELPSFVAQSERRRGHRLNLSEDREVKIAFAKNVTHPKPMSQHFFKACYDISTGGMAFDISRSECKLFETGDVLQVKELKVGEQAVPAEAEVVSIKEIEPSVHNGLAYKVWRVSCRFTQLSPAMKKYLQTYIFQRIKDELHAING